MTWSTFGKIMAKFLAVLNLIRKTAKAEGYSIEALFSLIDSDRGKEAMQTAVRIFIQEEQRLTGLYIEMLEAHKLMTFQEAKAWAEPYIKDGWRIPTDDDNYHRELKDLFSCKLYGEFYWLSSGWLVTAGSAGRHGLGSASSAGNHICVIRELPPKTWQLI